LIILEVGNIIPYKGDFYKITAINGDEVTLNDIFDDRVRIKVSYVVLKQTIISHNAPIKKEKVGSAVEAVINHAKNVH